MKKLIVFLTAAIMSLSLCIPAFAEEAKTEETYPVVGSWILTGVYAETGEQEFELQDKKDHASLYGEGINILTFDADGAGHDITFNAGDEADLAASWKSTSPDVYVFSTEGGPELSFTYSKDEDVLHRDFEQYDFVYSRAFIGSWTLDKVIKINDGDAPEELSRENAASYYGSGTSVITFYSDKTAKDVMEDGGEAEVKGSWELKKGKPDEFVYTEGEGGNAFILDFTYSRSDDTVVREYITPDPDAPYSHLHFVYKRVAEEEKEPAKAEPAKTADNKSDNSSSQAVSPKDTSPAPKKPDTNARTGFSLDIVAAQGGDANTIYELADGTFVDDSGVKYTIDFKTGYVHGSDGREWAIPGSPASPADVGRNFTGLTLILVNPDDIFDTIEISELMEGGFVDTDTGIHYYHQAGGGYFWTGDDDSTWVDMAYFEDKAEYWRTGVVVDVVAVGGGDGNTLYELNDGSYEDADGIVYVLSEDGTIFFGGDGSEWVFPDDDDFDDDDDDDDEPWRTGEVYNVVLAEGGDGNTLYELSDGTYEDDYGIIYYLEDDGITFFGADGSVWVIPGYDDGSAYGENEDLIFRTGNVYNVVAAQGGDGNTLYELNDGTYEDDYGTTYVLSDDGTTFFGDDGSVWVF